MQELTGASPSANLLTGLGVDELFQRAEGATTRTFLADALGSTLALADSAGIVQTSYTYAPYGETTVTGTASNNTTQYTGRENDSDGLYYFRARYYHPVMSRFVSEDPMGFGGGDSNLYAYAHDSPSNFTDRTGQLAQVLGGCAVGAVLFAGGYWLLSGRKASVGDVLKAGALGCVAGAAVTLGALWLLQAPATTAAAAGSAAGTGAGIAATRPTIVDQAFDAAGRVIYVGITYADRFKDRVAEHGARFAGGVQPLVSVAN